MHYNGASSCLFANGKEIYKFTAKDSEIIPYELCLKNISKGWSVDDMKKTGLKGCVYDFKVDHDSIFVSGITDIHKYLMKKKKKENIKCSILSSKYWMFFGLSNVNSLQSKM